MFQMLFFEVSAETSANVDAAFLRIASDVMQQSFMGVYPATCSLARFCLLYLCACARVMVFVCVQLHMFVSVLGACVFV